MNTLTGVSSSVSAESSASTNGGRRSDDRHGLKPRIKRLVTRVLGDRAATSISLRMTLAMTVITLIGAGCMIAGVLLGSRHEFSERGIDPNDVNAAASAVGTWVIDQKKALAFIVLFAVGIIVATALVGWYFSQRELAPLHEALRLQKNFVADASHELKTPLTVISLQTDLIEYRQSRGMPIDDAVKQLRGDVDRMNDIINDLLLAAQGAQKPEPVELPSVIAEAVETVRLLADSRHVTIDWDDVAGGVRAETGADGAGAAGSGADGSDAAGVEAKTGGTVTGPGSKTDASNVSASGKPITVLGGRFGLMRCIVAVLDNAIAHSPDDSHIRVTAYTTGASLRGSGREAVILVSDHGTGIGGDPERLFQRFARSDDGTAHQGYGLGLALARDVVSRYHGWIDVESSSPSGTTMRITMPLAE
ncbi:sensor histidine kinase [Bifidobacterium callimiconis]|uniref:histidine kinase n=1 Tax=Bifidobacterium callimiconis TaxID=2306973 RepID=A0A430FFA4_9BIFI|nr:HAMP domain-containing sensor histidine kinase [Bifidobacterium callimiconis]RSX51575.1 two-component system sensor histidine kinase [Bifidobacterium callimiconis]